MVDELEKNDEGKYLKNKYQMAIAATMLGRKGKFVFSRVYSGDGKTFVTIKLANSHVKLGDEVIIVVIDDLLFDQITEYT